MHQSTRRRTRSARLGRPGAGEIPLRASESGSRPRPARRVGAGGTPRSGFPRSSARGHTPWVETGQGRIVGCAAARLAPGLQERRDRSASSDEPDHGQSRRPARWTRLSVAIRRAVSPGATHELSPPFAHRPRGLLLRFGEAQLAARHRREALPPPPGRVLDNAFRAPACLEDGRWPRAVDVRLVAGTEVGELVVGEEPGRIVGAQRMAMAVRRALGSDRMRTGQRGNDAKGSSQYRGRG